MATGSLNVSTNTKMDNEIEELQNKDVELEDTLKAVSTKVSGDVNKPDTLTNTTTIVNTINKHTASIKNTMIDTGVLVTTTNQALNRIRCIYYSGDETLYAMVTATSGENNEKRNVALVQFTLGSDPAFKTIESDNLTITNYNSIGTFQYSDNTNIKIKAIVMDRDLFNSMWNDKSRLDSASSDVNSLKNAQNKRIYTTGVALGFTAATTVYLKDFAQMLKDRGYKSGDILQFNYEYATRLTIRTPDGGNEFDISGATLEILRMNINTYDAFVCKVITIDCQEFTAMVRYEDDNIVEIIKKVTLS